MRVLFVGTVPPPGGEGARAFGSLVSRAAIAGDDVEVLSPDWRSAAHAHANLSGVALAVHLAWRANRFDSLVLRIERDLPLRERTGRVPRALTLAALGASLSRYRDVTIVLDAPAPVPGGLGGRATAGLWRRATRIVVGSDEDRRQLLSAPGVDASRVEFAARSEDESSSDLPTWSGAGDAPTREAVLALVRTRAQRARGANEARAVLGVGDPGPLPPNVFTSVVRRDLGLPTFSYVAKGLYRRARRVFTTS